MNATKAIYKLETSAIVIPPYCQTDSNSEIRRGTYGPPLQVASHLNPQIHGPHPIENSLAALTRDSILKERSQFALEKGAILFSLESGVVRK